MSGAPRVLICDDEPQILHALRIVLSDAGFEALPTATAEEALDRAAVRPPEAAIIDLRLPVEDGVELCRRLRDWSNMPIIVLSAIDDDKEKIRALKAGADDYLTKPFSSGELIARLEAALRRASPNPEEARIVVGDLVIDLSARTVRHDGREIHLTSIEYDLLRVLAQNSGKLMTHHSLVLKVWGSAYEADTSTLRFHITNLRRKIEPRGRREHYIRTEIGRGYRFVS
jgi:two-component system, OmpR family, KDP operon response regulator KdpE